MGWEGRERRLEIQQHGTENITGPQIWEKKCEGVSMESEGPFFHCLLLIPKGTSIFVVVVVVVIGRDILERFTFVKR